MNRWVKNKRSEQIIKVNNQNSRLQNIKGLIQVYIWLNRGKWVNAKGILDLIKPWNLKTQIHVSSLIMKLESG